MQSLPLSEVATGICKASASATSSRPAPEARTPPPATMIGRSAFCRISSAGLDVGRFRLGTERRDVRELRLDQRVHLGLFRIELALVAAELQMHRPGAPEVAVRNACRTMSGKRATSSMVEFILVTGSNAGMSSISW